MEKQAGAKTTTGGGNGWAHTLSAWWPCWVLCLWALLIRVMAAGKVYPAQTDASHFVQYGKEYAAKGLDAISNYWSLLPQLLSGWSVRMGWSPQYVLQGTTVAFGVLLVAGVYALALELARSRTVAVVAGLLIATNPALTASATSGLSESPHMAVATWALVLVFVGVRTARVRWFALAGLVASVDMYYRSYDLFLYLAGAAPFVVWRMSNLGWKKGCGLVFAAVLTGALCASPFFAISAMKSAQGMGDTKMLNLAFGEYTFDSKAMYAAKGIHGDETPVGKRLHELRTEGACKFMWRHRVEIASNYPKNIVRGVRDLNDLAFTGMFRAGLFWFGVASVLCVVAHVSRGNVFLPFYLVFAMCVILGAYSLCFVHKRYILQLLPFFEILFGGGVAWLLSRQSRRRLQVVTWGCLLAMGALNGRWAVARLDDAWAQRNLFAACDRLQDTMNEDERLMCFDPGLPALFYKTNALCWDNIPYDSVEGVFALAEAHGVDCIVLDDKAFPHYPIHEIERNPALLPEPWKEVDRIEFECETRFGLEQNVFRFYRKGEGNAGMAL